MVRFGCPRFVAFRQPRCGPGPARAESARCTTASSRSFTNGWRTFHAQGHYSRPRHCGRRRCHRSRRHRRRHRHRDQPGDQPRHQGRLDPQQGRQGRQAAGQGPDQRGRRRRSKQGGPAPPRAPPVRPAPRVPPARRATPARMARTASMARTATFRPSVRRGDGQRLAWRRCCVGRATYSTALGSPVGDTTSGSFRFTCSERRPRARWPSRLRPSVTTPATSRSTPRADHASGRRRRRTRPSASTATARPVPPLHHKQAVLHGDPGYSAVQVNIGGSADCEGPISTAGDVDQITAPAGFYDVQSTFFFLQ